MSNSKLNLNGLSFKLKFSDFVGNKNLKVECNRALHEILGYNYINVLNRKKENILTIMEKREYRQ